MKILLGSNSSIKREAIQRAFKNKILELTCYPSSSEIPEQPIGREETKLGSFNRARNALLHQRSSSSSSQFNFSIGIENGMWEIFNTENNSNIEVDGACICILPGNWEGTFEEAITLEDGELSHPIFLWSDIIPIPPINERPFEVGPNGEWSILKDPHIILTNGERSRSKFLEDALIPFIIKLT